MIENDELKIDNISAGKHVDAGVHVDPDNHTSTTEKKRKKIARFFYDWIWFVGLLIQMLSIYIFYDEYERSKDSVDVEFVLIAGMVVLAVYAFTWMLSKIKRSIFTDFIWTISYGSIIFMCGVTLSEYHCLDESLISYIIAFIYWVLVWHCTRERE